VEASVTTRTPPSTEALALNTSSAPAPAGREGLSRDNSAAFVRSSSEALTHSTSAASVPNSTEALFQMQGQDLIKDVISSHAARKSKRGCKGGRRHRASLEISSVHQD